MSRAALQVPLLAVVLLAAAVAAPSGMASAHQRPAPARVVALTFDDLPYLAIAGTDYLAGARRTTSELLRVLDAHRAPAIGFVNENKLGASNERTARIALLRQWTDAGMTLGNHTYSHPDFNARTVAQFEEEIVKGETTIRLLQPPRAGGPALFFRHPMTHTGNTKEKKEAIEAFLAARGYRIAPHTIENSDFIFNVADARARASGDASLSARLRQAYLNYTDAATRFAEATAPKLFGRDIPHTLLLHANDINAACLDELLRRYEAQGYRFTTLESVMADPAYATRDTLVSDRGPTWLWRWRVSLGLNVSFAADPEVPAWVMELYNR